MPISANGFELDLIIALHIAWLRAENKIRINIEIPNFVFLDQWDKFLYDYNSGSFYNYDKVVYNFKIEDFINTFSNKNIEDFQLNENNKKKYLKEFCGYEGIEACEIFYKSLEHNTQS